MRHLALLCLALGAWGCSLPAAVTRGETLSFQGARDPGAVRDGPAAPPILAPGSTVERDAAPGERHEYRLPLAAGRYLRLTLDQRSSPVAAVLAGPDGRPVGEAGASPREGRRVLSAVTEAAGDYLLSVSAAAGGSYTLHLEEERAASEADPGRVAAQRALSAALARKDRADPAAATAVLADLEAARDLARAAGDGAGEADAWGEMGITHFYAGRLAEAGTAFAAAAARARQAGHAWGEAYALNNLGFVLQRQGGRAREAEAAYRRALALWATLDDPAGRAETLYNLGYLQCVDLNDCPAAGEHFALARDTYRRLGRVAEEGRSVNGLGLVARAGEDMEEALRLFGEALALAGRAKNAGLAAIVLRNRGNVRRMRGEPQEALEDFGAALDAAKADQETRTETLHDLATLYSELGDLEKAEETYRQVVALLPEDDPVAVNALINQGAALHGLGRPQEALELYRRALDRVAGRRPRQEALALLSQARAQVALGRPAEALPLLERSLAVRRQAYPRAEDAKALIEMGTALRLLGRREEAAARLEQALELLRAEDNPSLTATCLLGRARLDRDAGRLDEARAGTARAIGLIEQVRHRVADGGLRASFFSTKRGAYELEVDLLMRLDRLRPERGYAGEALAASEQARARWLLDLLAEGKIRVERGVDPELKRRETDLARDLATTHARLDELRAGAREQGPDEKERREIARLSERLLQVGRDQALLEGAIRRRNPHYAQVRYPPPLDADAVRGLLDERTVLVEYALGEEGSYLFAVTREGIEAHPLPPAGEIRGQVEELRRYLREPLRTRLGRYAELASTLYETLLGPVSRTLAAKPDLLIAPDGPLHLLPFEALLSGGVAANRGKPPAQLEYLLRNHAVTYVPSASTLAELRAPREQEPPASRKLFLAFGDPSYGGASPGEAARSALPALDPRRLARLPGSGQEVSGIAGLYRRDEVEIYLGAQASEANVKSNPLVGGARRVHFATHGLIDEVRPQLSGLALAPPDPGSGEDGVLRVDEIFNLPPLAADLVVLSACETALGKEVGGEGLVGLTQAFFYAGAPSLVVSLWKASDVSTPGLMRGFYGGLEKGESKGEALRRAKLKLVEEGTYAHPFYWAPFVLLGDSHAGR